MPTTQATARIARNPSELFTAKATKKYSQNPSTESLPFR